MAGGFLSSLRILGLASRFIAPTLVPAPEFPPANTGWEFYLRHTGRDGTVKQAVLNPLFCRYTKTKYGGRLEFGLNAEADEVATFVSFDLVEVWIRNTRLGIMDTTAASGRGFVRDERFIFRDYGYETDDDGITNWTAVCQSKWDVLSWRRVLWPTGESGYTLFTGIEAETVGKELVRLNATIDANVPKRWRYGDLAGMGFSVAIATDQGRGAQIERTTNGGDLQTILEGIAAGSGGDFTLTWTGLTSLELDFSEDQQGDDKYDTVIFSLAKRNMMRPRSRHLEMGSATVAAVAGQGRDGARQFEVVEDDGFAADNDIEGHFDARDLNTPAGLIARGRQKLAEQAARDDLSFEVRQTTDTFYSPVAVSGRNTYDVGDRVQAQYFGTYDRQVTAVTVSWTSEVPDISVELAGYVPIDEQDEVVSVLVDKLQELSAELAVNTNRPSDNKNNYSAAIDPVVTDDEDSGYNVGSLWITPTKVLVCRVATAGAAAWDQVN